MNALLTFGIIIYSIICVLLILIIIIQCGKAEGLFSSAQANVLGSQRGNALTKATTFLSVIFIVGALLISVAISSQKTVFEKNIDTTTTTVPQTSMPQEDLLNNQLLNTDTNTDYK